MTLGVEIMTGMTRMIEGGLKSNRSEDISYGMSNDRRYMGTREMMHRKAFGSCFDLGASEQAYAFGMALISLSAKLIEYPSSNLSGSLNSIEVIALFSMSQWDLGFGTWDLRAIWLLA